MKQTESIVFNCEIHLRPLLAYRYLIYWFFLPSSMFCIRTEEHNFPVGRAGLAIIVARQTSLPKTLPYNLSYTCALHY